MAAPSSAFPLSSRGSVRHWLVAGPLLRPYAGPPAPEHILRREALDFTVVEPPREATLGAPGPHGLPWRFHDPGRNEFVEFSTFYQELTVVEYFAFTELTVSESAPDESAEALFWAAGAADLWVDGRHIDRLNVTRYRYPDLHRIALPLAPGTHRLCVRLQVLGVRDTLALFGLFLPAIVSAEVRLPEALPMAEALSWIDSVRPTSNGLQSLSPAPSSCRVRLGSAEALPWPAGETFLDLGAYQPFSLTVETSCEGTLFVRQVEIPAHRLTPGSPPPDRREAHLAFVAKAGLEGETPAGWNARALPLLARRVLDLRTSADEATFQESLALIAQRRDCADFSLAALLRLRFLGLCTEEESASLRSAALAFRYWPDEPGSDAMCFQSENHSLLFHGCQWLAGLLYPGEIFSNSGRTGREQIPLARERVVQWLERIEERGFEEFNSGTYMPITVGAMLNLVDFSEDPEISSRLSAQLDRIFFDLADHAFQGAVVSPQGRIYRDVLFPEETGTQVLLAYASTATEVDLSGPRPPRERTGDWVVFLATSSRYTPPVLGERMRRPVSRIYRHGDAQIILKKTPSYILTSLAVPAIPRAGEAPVDDLRPGGAGYQQHLWQATLGFDCHIFANHPGGFFDGTHSRPGYWYGNGLIPRVRQEENWLQAIHVIADGSAIQPPITPDVWQWPSSSTVRPFERHPIDFVHLHWPADSFDREIRRGLWVFAQKAHGLIGVWCSEALVPYDDILTGRELRAPGFASAWLVLCGDLAEEGSLEAFAHRCESRHPAFDRATHTLHMEGTEPTCWWERSEPEPR